MVVRDQHGGGVVVEGEDDSEEEEDDDVGITYGHLPSPHAPPSPLKSGDGAPEQPPVVERDAGAGGDVGDARSGAPAPDSNDPTRGPAPTDTLGKSQSGPGDFSHGMPAEDIDPTPHEGACEEDAVADHGASEGDAKGAGGSARPTRADDLLREAAEAASAELKSAGSLAGAGSAFGGDGIYATQAPPLEVPPDVISSSAGVAAPEVAYPGSGGGAGTDARRADEPVAPSAGDQYSSVGAPFFTPATMRQKRLRDFTDKLARGIESAWDAELGYLSAAVHASDESVHRTLAVAQEATQETHSFVSDTKDVLASVAELRKTIAAVKVSNKMVVG